MKVKNLVVVIAVMLLLVSCVKKEDGRIVLRYSGPSFQSYDDIRSDVGKEFEKKYPEVKTVYEPISASGYFSKLQTQFAGNTEPDIFFMRDFELPVFVNKNVIMKLDDMIKEDKNFNLNDYHKILIKSYSMNNMVYGLPGSFTTGVIYYNKNIIDKTDLKPAKDLSWKNLITAGKKLTFKDKRNIVREFGIVLEYYDWMTFILQNNGIIFSKDRKRCIINTKSAVDAVEYLKSLYKIHHIMPNASDLEQSEAYQLFVSGRAALFTGGRWYTTTFNEIKNFKWGISPFFYGKKKATRLDSHSWVISKRTKHPKIAWEFLKFLTSKKANWKMVEVGDSVPIHKSNIKKFIKLHPENKVFIDSLKYAYTVDKIMSPYIPWREMMAIFNEEMDFFKIDKKSAGDSLKAIEKRINKVIKNNLAK